MEDCTCISLEQRGHGRSGRAAPETYTSQALVDDCIAFLEAVTGPAFLVGSSLGGLIGFGVASSRPDLVKALYSEDAVPALGTDNGDNVLPLLEWLGALGELARVRERDQLTLAQHVYNIGQVRFAGNKPVDFWPPGQLFFFGRHAYHTDPTWYDVAKNREGEWSAEEAAEISGNVRCPVHVAYGNPVLGGLVSPEDLRILEEAGVTLTSTQFPGAGHVISPNFPREFLKDLKAFLAKVG